MEIARLRVIVVHGTLLCTVFAGIASLSLCLDVSDARKPVDGTAVYLFVSLMLAAGIVWWSAVRMMSRQLKSGRRGFWTLIGFAILFRAIVFVAPPILELDVYRYLWDGFVSAAGVSPYRYTPSEIIEAVRFGESETDPQQRQVAAKVDVDADAREILDRVHYPDLPTIYPPVAQALFSASEKASRSHAIAVRLAALKFVFFLCEFATLTFTVVMLQRCGCAASKIALPAWCPLAVLSVANQGHLDSLPAMLTTAALASATFAPNFAAITLSGVFLGLASGSKIYPVILGPLIVVFLWRRLEAEKRLSRLLVFVVAFLGASGFVWSPLLKKEIRKEGFAAFADHWEMYDSFFAVVSANLTPVDAGDSWPWYSVVPEYGKRLVPQPARTSRSLWIVSVGVIALFLMRNISREPRIETLLESSFILLAWFWSLGPVCNPWYLTWLLPLLSFVRNPGWRALFVVAPCFYLRSALSATFGASGDWWFDHVVVLVLTGVWIVAVLLGRCSNQRLTSSSTGTMTLSDPDRNPSRSTLT